jgi:hypothetical protein
MKHLKTVKKYDGTLKELARDIANLRYDALATFLEELSTALSEDSISDKKRKRKRLSYCLSVASSDILCASYAIRNAWNICKKFIKE